MKTIKMKKIVVCAIAVAFVSPLGAQEPPDVIAFSSPANIEFMSGPIAFDVEPVTDAPYSADAVTEIVQTLADGNRIVREHKAQISRDGKGRTRREEGLAMFGPIVNGPGHELRNVQISDPTTGTMTMLDLNTKTAHRMPAPRMMLKNKIEGGVVDRFEMGVTGGVARGGVFMERRAAIAGTKVGEPSVEKLGTQFMEGVTVEGTRTTITIPAGQIGNELPIKIVSERWMSPELRVLVMSKQSDPRFGETTYRLTNVVRSEPAPELFEVPSDFTLMDPANQRNMIIKKLESKN